MNNNLKWWMKLILWLFCVVSAIFIGTFLITIAVAIGKFMF